MRIVLYNTAKLYLAFLVTILHCYLPFFIESTSSRPGHHCRAGELFYVSFLNKKTV